MESVNYEYFDSENDYSKNPNATKHRSFNVSRGNFSKYAILNGFYGKKPISRDARKFYSSMCRMAVKKEKGFYVISDEYEFAETSYKNVISFAMGMLATRIIANEIYNINKLYHFTDKSFKGTLLLFVSLYITKRSEAVLQWGKRKNIKKLIINGELVIE